MRYFANFSGDQIDGRFYEQGEEIEGADAGTLAFLVSNGRVTARPDGDDATGSNLGDPLPPMPQREPADMQRGELIEEARRHFGALIATLDDDKLRQMVAGARTDAAGDRMVDTDPATRDVLASLSGGSASSGPAPTGDDQRSSDFDAAAFVDRNATEVVADIAGLSPEQRAAVRKAEDARPGNPRVTVITALNAADPQ